MHDFPSLSTHSVSSLVQCQSSITQVKSVPSTHVSQPTQFFDCRQRYNGGMLEQLDRRGWSLEQLACLTGDSNTLQSVIRSGANVDWTRRSPTGETLLHLACLSGSAPTVALVLTHCPTLLSPGSGGRTKVSTSLLLLPTNCMYVLLGMLGSARRTRSVTCICDCVLNMLF